MKNPNEIVASGGFVRRSYRTQPIAVLIGSIAFVMCVITGISAIAVVALWRIDGSVPVAALRWTLYGLPVSALLIAITSAVAKREPEMTIFHYSSPNPEHNHRNLY